MLLNLTDHSAEPLHRQISVQLARRIIEGEIGAVGRVDNATGEGRKASCLTDPDELRAYVEQTGIDMVAVSIGNAHGNYPSLPGRCLPDRQPAASAPRWSPRRR